MQYMTPPKVAKLLGVSTDKVIRLIALGELQAFNLSNGIRPRWKIDPADLETFLDSRSNRVNRKDPAKKKRPLPVPSKDWV